MVLYLRQLPTLLRCRRWEESDEKESSLGRYNCHNYLVGRLRHHSTDRLSREPTLADPKTGFTNCRGNRLPRAVYIATSRAAFANRSTEAFSYFYSAPDACCRADAGSYSDVYSGFHTHPYSEAYHRVHSGFYAHSYREAGSYIHSGSHSDSAAPGHGYSRPEHQNHQLQT